jgi:hypothetical protein
MHRLDILPSKPFYPTASELHRAAECVAPWALGLPEAEEAPGEWAEYGKRMHGIAETVARNIAFVATTESEAQVLRYLQEAIALDRCAVRMVPGSPASSDPWLVEQGLQWRPGFPNDEARLVTRAPGERERGWFSGTVDLAYVRADGVLVVVDWKFGERTRWIGERAKDHAQLWTLALALATALGIRGSSENVIVARVEARHVNEDGIEVDGHDLTQGMLDAWADTLRKLARRIDVATDAAPKLSAACGRCRAKEACPAWQALEVSVFAEVSGNNMEALIRPPVNSSDVRALYHATEAAKSAVENWAQWIEAWCLVRPEGIEIGLGLKLCASEVGEDRVITTPEAMDAIERELGPGVVVSETKRKTTLKAIDASVGKRPAIADIKSSHDRKVARERAIESVRARLGELGAIRRKGSRWGVVVRRSDGTETVWKGNEEE